MLPWQGWNPALSSLSFPQFRCLLRRRLRQQQRHRTSWGSERSRSARERPDRSSLFLYYQLWQWGSAAFWKHRVQLEGRPKRGAVSGLELCLSGNSVPQTHFSAAAVGVLCWVALSSRCHHVETQPELTATALGWSECEWILSHWHSAKHLLLGLKNILSIVLSREGPSQGQGRMWIQCSKPVHWVCWDSHQAEALTQVQFLLNDSTPALQKWQMSPEVLLY